MIHARDDSSRDAPGDRLLADLMDQIQRELQAGQHVQLDAILEAHPQHAAEIRRLYQTICTISHGVDPRRQQSERVFDEQPVAAVLGDYRIVREVGRGGMGIVYEAQQLSLNRRVALKVLPFAAMFDERQRQRFRNEAAAAASLHHENIVPVYALGCQQDAYFYAMQFVVGQTVAHVIRAAQTHGAKTMPPHAATMSGGSAGLERLSRSTTLRGADESTWPDVASGLTPAADGDAYFRFVARVGMHVARALEYAHQRGVVHRDVKPSNLIIDEQGKVWITDFGLARFDHHANLTVSGDLLGTLRYMSPEQTRSGRLVDHRTDIYSLGVTLYELLALVPAFSADDRTDLIEQIRTSAPVAPSRHERHVPRDLETITLKAIAIDPEDRYQSAGSLARDLERFLGDKPIVARRPTLAGRLSRWTRRHSYGVSLGLIAVALLAMLASAAALWIGGLYHRAEHLAVRAEKKRIEAARVASRWHAERGSRRLEAGDPAGLLELVAAMEMASGLPEYDNLAKAWALWHGQYEGQLCNVVGHDGPVHALALHPGGHLLASASEDASVRLWRVPDGQPVRGPLGAPAAVVGIVFSDDGRYLAAGLSQGGVLVWNVEDDFQRVHSFHHGQGAVRKVAFSPEANTLATASEGDTYLRLWDVQTGKPRGPPIPQKEDQYDLAFSPDSSLLAMANSASRVAIWRIADKTQRCASLPHLHSVRFVRFLDGGQNLLTASLDCELRRWRLGGSVACEQNFRCDGVISQVAVHDASQLAAVGTVHGAVSLWNYETGEHRDLQRLHRTHIDGLAFSNDGRWLATCCRDGRARVFDIASGLAVGPKIRHEAGITDVVFSKNSELVMTASRDGTVRFWDAGFRGPVSVLAEGAGHADVRFSRDGMLLGAVAGNRVCLWHADRGQWESMGSVEDVEQIAAFDFHPTLNILATATSAQTVRFWDVVTKREVGEALYYDDWVRSVAFRADGSRLAVGTGAHNRTVWLYTGRPGSYEVEAKRCCLSGVASLEFSPSDAMLAAATHHGLVLLDLAEKGASTQRLVPDQSVMSASFHPAAQRIALGLRLPAAWIVDVAGRKHGAALRHPGRVSAVAFSPDGTALVTCSRDANARVWYGLDTQHPYCVCLPHPRPVKGVAYHPAGHAIATSCADGCVRVWAVPRKPSSLPDAVAATRRTVAARWDGDAGLRALAWRQWQSP